MVFLAGERAYKLKRSIRFSYLDFSTIERREAACRAKVELNRRTAADLYLGVHSITREGDGSVDFDGAGTLLDWVVVMRRFDQELLFDRLALAARGALNVALMEQLSAEIARFHAAAELQSKAWQRRKSCTAPRDAFSRELCTALVRRWRAELDRHAALLDRRDEGGKVRRCQGDLRLRNICLWHGRPTLFDCIEFSERLACIAVLYDLAFC